MASSCCGAPTESEHRAPDWLLRISFGVITVSIIVASVQWSSGSTWIDNYCMAVLELMLTMWWGLLLGIIFVGILNHIPREVITSILGKDDGIRGLIRATLAGLLLDLCSHGILLVGMKLYERGASLGQTMAFLIASPWNSLSLTLILASLIGIPWTLTFIILSAVIAVISGLLFQTFIKKGILPKNHNRTELDQTLTFKETLAAIKKSIYRAGSNIPETISIAFKESQMIIRWLFLGVIIASVLRASLSVDQFQNWFGPHVSGLGATLLFATIFEACSEGSSPIAADILTMGKAPGNAFAFLMTGVATDYTEIMGIKEGTKSWKVALFLPLITVPQVILLALILNLF